LIEAMEARARLFAAKVRQGLITRTYVPASTSSTDEKTNADKVDFLVGFHAVPNQDQLHLHLLSSDLSGDDLRSKKKWQSFTTKFFVSTGDIIQHLTDKGVVQEKDFSVNYKDPLRCPWCDETLGSLGMRENYDMMVNADMMKEHASSCSGYLAEGSRQKWENRMIWS